MSVHDDRLHAEVDRQLGEVRAACDGLATRSGLLITATGVVATLVAVRIGTSRHEVLLVLTVVALGLAALADSATLVPWLKIGPASSSLAAWMAGVASAATSDQLYDTKIAALDTNMRRSVVMRTLFVIQTIATLSAVGLALSYSAWR